jgi:hypothetical protein
MSAGGVDRRHSCCLTTFVLLEARMRTISLPLALCIVIIGCGGHDNRQTPADSAALDSAAAELPPDTTNMQGTGAVALPPDSAAVRDSTRARGTATMTKPRTTTRSDTSSASRQQQSKADSDSVRKFKKPEIRPIYPPINRRDTSRDSSAQRDTSVRPDPTKTA